MVGTIQQIIKENLGDNHHFFVNSVDLIAKVIKKAGLVSDQVKVVCSKNNQAIERNKTTLGAAYKIEQSHDPVKRFNFYTSTCFEGCDIFDANGRTYVVSDGHKAQTLVDISTQFIQICGRIRDSKYKSEITHIFSTTKYSKEITLADFIQATKNTLAETKQLVASFNSMDQRAQKAFSERLYLNEMYIRKENDTLSLDENLACIDIVNFKICHCIYGTYTNLCQAQQTAGYEISVTPYTKMTVSEQVAQNPNAKLSFEQLFKEYCKNKALDSLSFIGGYHADLIAQKTPLIKEAYDKLGADKVEELKYKVSNIRRAVVKELDVPMIHKVVALSNKDFKTNCAIPVSEVKAKLQAIYDTLGIKHTATATDLNRWYETKPKNRIVDGKCTSCIVIIRQKWSSSK